MLSIDSHLGTTLIDLSLDVVCSLGRSCRSKVALVLLNFSLQNLNLLLSTRDDPSLSLERLEFFLHGFGSFNPAFSLQNFETNSANIRFVNERHKPPEPQWSLLPLYRRVRLYFFSSEGVPRPSTCCVPPRQAVAPAAFQPRPSNLLATACTLRDGCCCAFGCAR